MPKITVPENQTDKAAELMAGLETNGVQFTATLVNEIWEIEITGH